MSATILTPLSSTAGTVIPEVRVESAPGGWSNAMLIGVLGLFIGTGGIASASSLPSWQVNRDVRITICEEGRENGAATELSSVPEQLSAIQRYLSLNVSELAFTFGVSRQTVHKWINAQKEPHPHRRAKIESVFEIAREWRSISSTPLGASLHKRIGDASVLDALAREPLDEQALRSKLRELHHALVSTQSRKSIAEVARAKGRTIQKQSEGWKDDDIL